MKRLPIIALLTLSACAHADPYRHYAPDGRALGYAYDEQHPLEGQWIGTGWSYHVSTGNLGAAFFACQVDGSGQFACDAMARDKATGACVQRGYPFFGRMVQVAGPLWNVAYEPSYEGGLTIAVQDGGAVTITTIAKPSNEHIMAGFIEHTSIVRAEANVAQALDIINDYRCEE
jgi:hypothetical protein